MLTEWWQGAAIAVPPLLVVLGLGAWLFRWLVKRARVRNATAAEDGDTEDAGEEMGSHEECTCGRAGGGRRQVRESRRPVTGNGAVTIATAVGYKFGSTGRGSTCQRDHLEHMVGVKECLNIINRKRINQHRYH
jgi:hypothetical protein